MFRRVLDEAISLVKENVLSTNSIDWKVLEPKVRALSGGAQQPSETYGVIRWLLSETRDLRSYFVPSSGVKALWAAGAPTRLPVVRALADGVGYVSASGQNVGDLDTAREYARGAEARLASIATSTRCGLVLDLRGNTGGDTGPLLAGLKTLFTAKPAHVTPLENVKGLEVVRVAALQAADSCSELARPDCQTIREARSAEQV